MSFQPKVTGLPDLHEVDFGIVGQGAPKRLPSTAGGLPDADVVVVTWASAEWAALQHVFVSGDRPMPYADRDRQFRGWARYDDCMPSAGRNPSDPWDYWGLYRLVEITGQRVLLFKSNTHLTWPGQKYLEELIGRLLEGTGARLLLSIGTAGGTRTTDHVGTVNVTNAGTYYQAKSPRSEWKTYASRWSPNGDILSHPRFPDLLQPIPVTGADLRSVAKQFNEYYRVKATLRELDVDGLDHGDRLPRINDLTGPSIPLVTTSEFIVGATAGKYSFKRFACIEMDDAVVGKICRKHRARFGFVRNISNPIQNAKLSQEIQGNWGGAIYGLYGLYTSFNGALATWAIVAGEGSR